MARPLVFTVRRSEAELVAPAGPTPHEFKRMSDIDDQDGLRFHIPSISFYRSDRRLSGRDPARVIREALARALVLYYPLAGRLREGPGRKLSVECTGEGVLFIEADADVRLEQFGEELQPPFPCFDELLFDVPGSAGVLNSPLLLIQVTRLLCGGFIVARRLNHVMADAAGLAQFLNAVAEMARGRAAPTVMPVWRRELLESRNDPPRPTCIHREYDDVAEDHTVSPLEATSARRSFFFGPEQISALKTHLPPHLRTAASTFDVLTACLWKCRTVALRLDPDVEVRLTCVVDARNRFDPPLPRGFYGNAIAYPTAAARAGRLCGSPLGYAVGLVKKAKSEVTEEYMRSVADLMVLRGRPHFAVARSYIVSDLTRAGVRDVDFGWGKAAYGGTARGRAMTSTYVPSRDGIVVPVCLPGPAMERFAAEVDRLASITISSSI